MTGLPDYVKYICTRTIASRYHIGGFHEHVSEDVLKLCLVFTPSSFCSDAVLLILMADDRLPHQLEEIDGTIAVCLDKTEDISRQVWGMLHSAVGFATHSTQSEAIDAAWNSACIMESRLREARGLPWSLLKGDRVANLQKLRDNPRPSESNAGRMWDGMNCLDLPPQRYLGILDALDRLSWLSSGRSSVMSIRTA